MQRPRLTSDEAMKLVQLACTTASSPPGAALLAILDALRDLLHADCAIACGIEGSHRAWMLRLLRASMSCSVAGGDLVDRVAAIEPETFGAVPVLRRGADGPLALLATGTTDHERVVIA